jgi:hypothetical protein
MSFQNKYLKYKNKYLDLKNQIGGSSKKVPPKSQNVFDCKEKSPINSSLILAAMEGHDVEYYLDRGCDVNARDKNDKTALIHATGRADIENVRELLRYGADVNIVDKGGWTALNTAAAKGYTNIQILLEDRLRAIAKAAADAKAVEDARLAEVARLAAIAKLESDRLAEVANLKAEVENLKAEIVRLTEEAKSSKAT